MKDDLNFIKTCHLITPHTGEAFPIDILSMNLHNFKVSSKHLGDSFRAGTSIRIKFELASHIFPVYSLELESKILIANKNFLILMITKNCQPSLVEKQLTRKSPFALCPLPIVVSGLHPWLMSLPIQFILRDYISERLYLEILSEKGILYHRGMRIRIKINIPYKGSFPVTLDLEDFFTNNDKTIMAGKILECPLELKEQLSLYLLENGAMQSLGDLQNSDLPIPSFKKHARCYTLSSEEDYRQVIELRANSYAGKSNSKFKMNSDDLKKDFRDEFDYSSNIFIIKIGNQAIGTGRVVYNYGKVDNSELVRLGFKPPKKFLEEGFTEVSRLATDNRLRGRDIFLMLISFAFSGTVGTGHRFLLASCEDSLLPVYKRWGARTLAQSVQHPLEGVTLNIIYFDTKAIMKKARWLLKIPLVPKKLKQIARTTVAIAENPFKNLQSKID